MLDMPKDVEPRWSRDTTKRGVDQIQIARKITWVKVTVDQVVLEHHLQHGLAANLCQPEHGTDA